MNNIRYIINNNKHNPNIINADSKFVIITYWWGKNVENLNTARPYVSFYETIISVFIKAGIHILSNIYNKPKFNLIKTSNKLLLKLTTKFWRQLSKAYIYDMCRTLNIEFNIFDRDIKIIQKIETLKKQGRCRPDFYFKTDLELQYIIFNLFIRFWNSNIDTIIDIYKKRADKLYVYEQTREIQRNIKTSLIYTELFDNLNFLRPITYDKMIQNWKQNCKYLNCNYLAIEYPQFASKGGYQLAINAKATFILHALKLNNICPCITAQSNLWCVYKSRFANIKEILMLQGFDKNFIQVVSKTQLKKQLGNSMSVNVLGLGLKNVLKVFIKFIN